MFDSAHHLVIDLETFALSPRAMVRSVGLAFFNPWTDSPPQSERIVLDPSDQEGREIDPQTMLWWMTKPERARRAFTMAGVADRAYLKARLSFAPLVVWCKPLHFDVPILLDLLRPIWPSVDDPEGILYRRRVHNARTIYEAASLLGERVDEDPTREGISPDELHDPSVDATLTALTVRRALRIGHGQPRGVLRRHGEEEQDQDQQQRGGEPLQELAVVALPAPRGGRRARVPVQLVARERGQPLPPRGSTLQESAGSP